MKNEKLLLALLAAVQFTNILDFVIMMPLGPQLMPALGIVPRQFGLVISAYTFSAGATGLAAAFFLDRFNRKTALLALYLGFGLGTVACALAPTYHWLVAARVLTGAFGGVLGSLVLAIVGDAVPEGRRGQAIGIVMGAFSVASVLGIPFGLFLASRFSWHLPFFVLGGLSLLVWAVIYFVMPSMAGHISSRVTSPRERIADVLGLFRRSSVRYALLLTALLVLGQFTVISFLSPSLVGNVGFTVGQLGYVYLVGGALTFFTSPLIGRLADRHGKVLIFTIATVATVPVLLIITRLTPTPLPIVLTLTAAMFAVMGGRYVPATALATTVVPPWQRGSFMSLNTSIQQLAAGAAAYLAGLIVVQTSTGQLLHYEVVGYIAAAANVVSLLVIRRIQPAPVPAADAASTPDKVVVNTPLSEQVVE
ncbi:MFS transporter [Hymenobacter sp. BT175]|uniref:MFS transporter n=1 Tax=Hymenobacter translucens TaxID=2886507 RepID=UPI001D0EBF51|nr:MFS transporter [Hymenobacter translucens]MCC2546897.1 MFS transporter [Hymenobacter translucens]